MELGFRSEFKLCMMFLTVLVFLMMTLCHVVQGRCDNLTVFRGSEKISTDSVCIERYPRKDCLSFAKSFNQSLLPPGYPVSDLSVEKPSYITLEGIDSVYLEYIAPGMSIKWRTPKSKLSRLNCYGYLISWNNNASGDPRCVLFWMKNGTGEELLFQYDLEFVNENSTYHVKVHSMPPFEPSQKDDEGTFVSMYSRTPLQRYAFISPGNWTPFLAYETFRNGTIDLKISLPPAEYNLTHFDIYLNNQSDGKTVQQSGNFVTQLRTTENTQASVTFNTKTSGFYHLVVWVKDEFRMIKDKCRCWIIMNNERTCTNSCGGTRTEAFYVNITSPVIIVDTTPATTDLRSVSTTLVSTTLAEDNTSVTSPVAGLDGVTLAVIGGIFGFLFLALLVTTVVCCVKRNGKEKVRNWIHSIICRFVSLPKPSPSLPSPDVPFHAVGAPYITKKTLFVLSADDHDAHKELVECFIRFLEVHCRCSVVSQADSDLCIMDSYEWFQSRVHTCDYLIFVDSEAARNLTDAHLQNKTYRERRTGPRGDVFLYGLKHILFSEQVRERATVLVSFHGNHCQRYLQASKVFMLPGDFPYFLQKIHGFSAADAAVLSRVLPMIVSCIPELSEGSRMLSASQRVKSYEENNPGWFQNNFGNPKPLYQSGSSHESGDSGRPPSPEHLDSVSQQFSDCDTPSVDKQPPSYDLKAYQRTHSHPGRSQTNPPTASSIFGGSCITILSEEVPQKLPENSKQCPSEQRLDGITIVQPETVSEITFSKYSSVTDAFNAINNSAQWQLAGQKRDITIIQPETVSEITFTNYSTITGAINAINDSAQQHLAGLSSDGAMITQPKFPALIEASSEGQKQHPSEQNLDGITVIHPEIGSEVILTNHSTDRACISEDSQTGDPADSGPTSDSFMESIIPPDCLSDTLVDDLNLAFMSINANTDLMNINIESEQGLVKGDTPFLILQKNLDYDSAFESASV